MGLITWTSGTNNKQDIAALCQNDLVTVTIRKSAGVSERPDDLGYFPHLLYVPRFEGRDVENSRAYGGQSPPDSWPLEFHINIEPFWSPYDGQLYIIGGDGGVTYEITVQKSRCQPRPLDEPTIIMYAKNNMAEIQMPRGAHQVKQFDNSAQSMRLTMGGYSAAFYIGKEWSPLGFFSQGTFSAELPTTSLMALFKVRM
jgi:hypothetical protein